MKYKLVIFSSNFKGSVLLLNSLLLLQGEEEPHIKPTAFDMDKVKTTIKQFVRDWSEAGRTERAACYDPVIVAVEKRFPPDTQ